MSDQSPAEQLVGALGTWEQHHTGIVVADFERSIAFYSEMLGFEPSFEVRGMAEQFAETVGVPGVSCDLAQLYNPRTRTRIELIRVHDVPTTADAWLPVHVGVAHTAYLVEDLEAAAELIARAGGSMLGRIVDFEEGPAAYFRVPGGTVIEVEQPRDSAHEGKE